MRDLSIIVAFSRDHSIIVVPKKQLILPTKRTIPRQKMTDFSLETVQPSSEMLIQGTLSPQL